MTKTKQEIGILKSCSNCDITFYWKVVKPSKGPRKKYRCEQCDAIVDYGLRQAPFASFIKKKKREKI